MVIDFHMHSFDEKIAQRAIEKLEITSQMKAYTRGTTKEILDNMQTWGVDKGVILPVATKPTQQTVINNWAVEQMLSSDGRLYAFGSVHPDAEDVLSELERIKILGLKGVKIHHDYMNFCADDESYYFIFEKCAELKLPVLFHGGFDPLSPDLIHCTPKGAAKVFRAVPDLTLIVAHLGGMNMWDEVEEQLCGLKGNLYLDTAVIAGEISEEQLRRIIGKHGADRILFASDCPWHAPYMELEMIRKLNLPKEDEENILYKNALKILGN